MKKDAEAMVKVIEKVITVLTCAGALITAVANLIDYVTSDED